MNNVSSQNLVGQLLALCGDTVEVAAAIEMLADLAGGEKGNVRIPNWLPLPNGKRPDDFFVGAERCGLFVRRGENAHGVDGSVWALNTSALKAARVAVTSLQ